MGIVAFFPWIRLEKPLTIGPVRLIPYERGQRPGDLEHVSQHDIDGVLAAYTTRRNRPVTHAALMELGNWRLGQEADAEVRADLFRARELIAFTALARRRLFRHFDYCNFDSYAFVLQNYQANQTGVFSFTSRRRDGYTPSMWDNEEFAFLKPLHVAADARITIDQPLLAALLAADEADQAPFEAIVEFNRANTDQDGPIHTELVLTKSAFEFLFGISERVDDFVEALRLLVPERAPERRFEGPLAQRWPQRKGAREIRPLEAWAREFCIRRNESAHGRRRRADENFVWSEEAHLAYCSLLFPLLVKARLCSQAFLDMNEIDRIELEWIEAYLMYDPFERPADGRRRALQNHPWNRIHSDEIMREKLRRHIEATMQHADFGELPEPSKRR
jgi:hypothetical protein